MRVREAGTRTLGSAAWAVTLVISGKQRAPVLGDSASRWLSAGGVVEQLRPEPRPWGVDSAFFLGVKVLLLVVVGLEITM